MNQTSNYQLNQWDPEDRILRTDFNEDNAKLDAALADIDEQFADQNIRIATNTSDLKRRGNCRIYARTRNGDGSTFYTVPFSGRPEITFIRGQDRFIITVWGVNKGLAFKVGGSVSTVDLEFVNDNAIIYRSTDPEALCNVKDVVYNIVGLIKLA